MLTNIRISFFILKFTLELFIGIESPIESID